MMTVGNGLSQDVIQSLFIDGTWTCLVDLRQLVGNDTTYVLVVFWSHRSKNKKLISLERAFYRFCRLELMVL